MEDEELSDLIKLLSDRGVDIFNACVKKQKRGLPLDFDIDFVATWANDILEEAAKRMGTLTPEQQEQLKLVIFCIIPICEAIMVTPHYKKMRGIGGMSLN